MLRDFYKYMCVSLAALLAAACADLPETTEVPDPQEPRYMTFDISEIDTKVSDSEDLKSYEFSIWIYESEKKTEPLVDGDDVKLKYDSDSDRWRFHKDGSFIDVPWGDGNHDFFVVSSYVLSGTSEKIRFDKSAMGYIPSYINSMARFVVPAMNMTNSSDGFNYYKDILYAAASRDVSEDGYKPVSLTLGHLWPALEFNMINETDQKKYITDFSVSNFRVNSNTTIEFSASSGYNTTPPSNNSDDFATNKYEVAELVLLPGEQRSVFGMPVMVFPQKFVSDEYSAILSFSVDGVKKTKSFYVNAPDGLSTQEWNPGRLYSYDIRLTTPTPPLEISPNNISTSVEHIRDANGVLTHSALNLNLNLEYAQRKRVKNLRVVVSKGGETYLDQTFATVSSNEMTLYKGSASDPGRFYMPQGDYQVTLTYNDGFYDHTVTCEATSLLTQDDYTLTVNVSATSNQFTVNSMSVNIADRVLAECPLKGHSTDYIFWVRGNTGQKFIYTSDGGVSLTSSNIVSNVTFSNLAPQTYGYYTIYPYVNFDGVVKEAANFNIVTSNKYEEQYKQNIHPDVKKYKKSDQLSSATELQDGKMYILEASEVHTGYYWRVGSDGQLEFSSALSSFDDIPENYIFMYKVDNAKSVTMQSGYYNYSPVGAWYSVSKEKYMNDGDYPPYFNLSTPVRYVKCGTGWNGVSGNKFDISKGYNGGVPELLRYSSSTSSEVYWGTNGEPNVPQYWKWYIYEVVYE